MKPGDPIQCPHCGADSFLKKESVMDGWTKVGEVLKCASCSAVIADCTQGNAARESSDAADRFKKFLGAEDEAAPSLTLSETDKRFCKDCAHMIPHPFQLRCERTGQNVNPMNDCPFYTPKHSNNDTPPPR